MDEITWQIGCKKVTKVTGKLQGQVTAPRDGLVAFAGYIPSVWVQQM